MLILSGFSQERSTYCRKTHFLRLSGWVLSPKISCIQIQDVNNHQIRAKVNIIREDINKAFNKTNKKCGWEVEKKVKNFYCNDVKINYCDKEGNIIFSQKIDIQIDKEKEIYLEQFNCLKFQKTDISFEKIIKKLKTKNIKLYDLNFDEKQYIKWFKDVDYCKNYPKYCEEFKKGIILHTKAMQHFISLELMQLTKDNTYLDIASSNSVCPDIVRQKNIKVYKQDFTYKSGIHDNIIGSNANNIPLEDNFIDAMTLHCSFEHFENNDDIKFLKEAHRILKPNGKIVITPLYLSQLPIIFTSPTIWNSKYNMENYPKFTKNYALSLNEKMKQRQEKYFSPNTLRKEILTPFSSMYNIKIYHMQKPKDDILVNYPAFTLLLIKK